LDVGDTAAACLLLEEKYNTNEWTDIDLFRIASRSIKSNRVGFFRVLLKKKLNLNVVPPGIYDQPLLHQASMQAKFEIVKMLLDAGADIDIADENGETALLQAARSRVTCPHAWVESFGGKRYILDKEDCGGYVVDSGGIVSKLATTETKSMTINLLLDHGSDVHSADRSGRTVLCHVAETGTYASLQKLLSLGADPNDADANGRTALMFAVMNSDFASVKCLIEGGANTKARDHNRKSVADLVGKKNPLAIENINTIRQYLSNRE